MAGKYRLRRLLATGGMGEVWVARNEATEADVALKVLLRHRAGGAAERDVEERFRQEARLSATLAHRNIVKVFDLVEEPDGTLVLVLELLRGETLHDYARRLGPRPALEAVAIVAPILGALAHAHAEGLVHRDVSPANIFLAIEPDGRVIPKLVDFGIAKRMESVSPSLTVAGDVLGTPRYMAPERVRDSTDVDGRADVFSAAVVLYELVTGVCPFAANSAAGSLAAVLERTVDPDPRIEPRVWLELRRALAKRPYERHATASELATALRTALGVTEDALEAALQATLPQVTDTPAEDVPRTSLELIRSGPSPRLLRRRVPGLAWLAGAGALAAGAAIAALVLGRGASRPPPAPAPPVLPASSGETAAPQRATAAPAEPPATALSPPPAPASASASAPASPSAAVPRPRPLGRPKPVATTPGF